MGANAEAERAADAESMRLMRAKEKAREMAAIVQLWPGRESTAALARSLGLSENALRYRLAFLGLVPSRPVDM